MDLINHDDNLDKLIFQLLMMDGNDTNLLDDEETLSKYNLMLKSLMKKKFNIRWCHNLQCPCHPEPTIQDLLNEGDLMDFLDAYGIHERLYELDLYGYEINTVTDVERANK